MTDYSQTVIRWLVSRGFNRLTAASFLRGLDAGDWVVQPCGSTEDFAEQVKARHRQYERVSEGLLAVLNYRWLSPKARQEIEQLQLELWNALGKTRDTLAVYGFGDVGEPESGPE